MTKLHAPTSRGPASTGTPVELALDSQSVTAPYCLLSPDLLRQLHADWRATNSLSVGLTYYYDNPRLIEPLRLSHVKPTFDGQYYSNPCLNFTYTHLNQTTKKYDLNTVYVAGYFRGACIRDEDIRRAPNQDRLPCISRR
ncbi:MAG: hypothetical protein ABJA67_02915 [Chthonomonadales bacterium]